MKLDLSVASQDADSFKDRGHVVGISHKLTGSPVPEPESC